MNVFRLLAVSLIVAGCAGCGNDAVLPPAAPPPKFQPASDLLTAKEAADKPGAIAPTGDVAPTGGAETTLDADESPAETASNEEMADETDSSDESDQDEPAATTETGSSDPLPDSTAEKPVDVKSGKAKSGKWMRGLTNALNRAIAKSLDRAAEGGAAQGAGAAAKPPAPEDDPFPKGEPEEEKPKE